MKLTNRQMDEYFYFLSNIASKTKGKLAFAVAKNMRKIQDELVEYTSIKDSLIQKYGEPASNGLYQINIESDNFKKYAEEMKEYNKMESEINITMVNPEDVYDSDLDAKEVMSILFMINDQDEMNIE